MSKELVINKCIENLLSEELKRGVWWRSYPDKPKTR